MNSCKCTLNDIIPDSENRKELRNVLVDLGNVAREQQIYELAFTAARRSAVLLGTEVTGSTKHRIAEMHFHRRQTALAVLKKSFTKMIESTDRDLISKDFKKGLMEKFMQNARETVILNLIESSISVEEAEKVVEKIDTTVATFHRFTSLKDVGDYSLKHIDELMEKKMGNPSSAARDLCIFILAISSILALLYAAALFLCIFYSMFGQEKKCELLLNHLIDYICGSEA